MKKITLTLCCSAIMIFAASTVFADQAKPDNPCEKPSVVNAETMGAYESCMASFTKSQNVAIEYHRQAIMEAEAALDQPREAGGGSKK